MLPQLEQLLKSPIGLLQQNHGEQFIFCSPYEIGGKEGAALDLKNTWASIFRPKKKQATKKTVIELE